MMCTVWISSILLVIAANSVVAIDKDPSTFNFKLFGSSSGSGDNVNVTHTDYDIETHVTTAEAWGFSMIGVGLSSIVSLSGITLLIHGSSRITSIMTELMALSAGTLLGAALLSIFPETSELIGFDLKVNVVVLTGILFGMISEHLVHGHHHDHVLTREVLVCEEKQPRAPSNPPISHISIDDNLPAIVIHGDTDDHPKPVQSSSTTESAHRQHRHHHDPSTRHLMIMNLAGDAIHNMVDGALIGATFLESTTAGFVISLAIALHELPQEISDFAVLLHSGLSARAALCANFCVSLTAFIGAILTLAVGSAFQQVTSYFLPFAGGLFIYLSLACLLPEVQRLLHDSTRKKRIQSFVAFGIGLGMMALLLLLPHEEHNDEHGHE